MINASLEVVTLPNGRFTVQEIGDGLPIDDAVEFATQAEAEEWMFTRMQHSESLADDPIVIKPGQGQGIG